MLNQSFPGISDYTVDLAQRGAINPGPCTMSSAPLIPPASPGPAPARLAQRLSVPKTLPRDYGRSVLQHTFLMRHLRNAAESRCHDSPVWLLLRAARSCPSPDSGEVRAARQALERAG